MTVLQISDVFKSFESLSEYGVKMRAVRKMTQLGSKLFRIVLMGRLRTDEGIRQCKPASLNDSILFKEQMSD